MNEKQIEKEKTENLSDVITMGSTTSVNSKFADSFFKKIFEKQEAVLDLLDYIEEPIKQKAKVNIIQQEPVLIGNRKNDLAFLLNDTLYYFFEQQSTDNFNMPIRFLFYISRALENYLAEQEKNVYGKTKVKLPEVKSYAIFTGIGKKAPESLVTIQRLSDSYLTKESSLDLKKQKQGNDIEKGKVDSIPSSYHLDLIPNRFKGMEHFIVQYAMFVNTVKYEFYQNEIGTNTDKAKQIVVKVCNLFLKRGYLVFYFTNKEVINMAIEQLSAEEVIRFQEREEGREEHLKE